MSEHRVVQEICAALPRGTDPNEQRSKNYAWNTRDRLGAGGFGKVYKGRHRIKNLPVAVKVFNASDSKHMENFEMLSKLDFPNIIKYIAEEEVIDDSNQGTGMHVLVMELAEGSVLDELNKDGNRNGLPKDVFLKLLNQCVDALHYLDEKKIVHRDIKPENILVRHYPNHPNSWSRLCFKLTDFGLCHQLGEPGESMHTVLGTKEYMARELIYAAAQLPNDDDADNDDSHTRCTQEGYSSAVDLWSAACCFFECATNRIPFRVSFIANGMLASGETQLQRYYACLSRVHETWPPNAVYADFDSRRQAITYNIDMPLQHPSFSRGYQCVLRTFFRYLFAKDKKFLKAENFYALHKEMVSLRKFEYHFLNTSSVSEYYISSIRHYDQHGNLEGYENCAPTQYFQSQGFEYAVRDEWTRMSRLSGDKSNNFQYFGIRVAPQVGSDSSCPEGFTPTGKEGDCIAALLPSLPFDKNGAAPKHEDLYLLVLYEEDGGVRKVIERRGFVESQYFRETNLLDFACNEEYDPIICYLLDRRPDVNAGDHDNQTLPGSAAQNGNNSEAEALINRGADAHAADEAAAHLLASVEDVDAKDENGSTPLLLAARNGQDDVARMLINLGADVNAADKDGKTSVMEAASNGHLDLVKALVENGADINVKAKESFGYTALHYACVGGHVETAKYLLDKEASVDARNQSYQTPLICAAENGKSEVAEMLIGREADVNAANNSGETAVIAAAISGHLNVLKTLVNNGADIDATRNDGYTALHLACETGHDDIALFLLEIGANVNSKTDCEATPLMYAAMNGKGDVAAKLIARGADVNEADEDGETAVMGAAFSGNLNVLRMLICHGADIETRQKEGYTALHFACKTGHGDIAAFLLDIGTDVNARTVRDTTPLMCAAMCGSDDVADMLITRGAEIDAVDIDGATAAMTAAINGHLNVLQTLVSHGADIKARRVDKYTALHCACQNGHGDIADFLLNIGLDINARSVRDTTPLMCAAMCGSDGVAAILIARGAGVNCANVDDVTPIIEAAFQGHLNVVKVLVDSGANINAKTKFGYTALHHACERGHLEMVSYLLDNGADVKAKNIWTGCPTPLKVAENNGQTGVVELLRSRGAKK